MAQTRRDLPAWYHRLVARDIEPYPRDFDQDISDICTSDEEVEDGADSPDSRQSNRSYQGPDARYYYRLKQQRKWRKLGLRDIREQWQREMEECRLFEKKKEEETQRVYDSVKNIKEGKSPFLRATTGKTFHFNLYSTDHVTHCYSSPLYPRKYIEFYNLGDENTEHQPLTERDAQRMYGHVYLNADRGCEFGLSSFLVMTT